MTVHTTAGTIIAVTASAPGTFNAAGYNALAFTTIGEVTDHGEHGREYSLVTHQPVDSRGDVKFKGGFNEGSKTLQLGLDDDNAGQVLLKAAVNSDNDYSFKVTYPDGDIDYFRAKVMTFKKGVGSRDQVTSATVTLEITTDSATGTGIVEVNA